MNDLEIQALTTTSQSAVISALTEFNYATEDFLINVTTCVFFYLVFLVVA